MNISILKNTLFLELVVSIYSKYFHVYKKVVLWLRGFWHTYTNQNLLLLWPHLY